MVLLTLVSEQEPVMRSLGLVHFGVVNVGGKGNYRSLHLLMHSVYTRPSGTSIVETVLAWLALSRLLAEFKPSSVPMRKNLYKVPLCLAWSCVRDPLVSLNVTPG